MSRWNDRSGWRHNLKCPLCDKAVWYMGDIDTTAYGDSNSSRVRGVYICRNANCENRQKEVKPVPS